MLCFSLKNIYNLIPNSTYAAPSEFLLVPYESTLTELKEILKDRSNLVPNYRSFKWNTTPETKSQKVDPKQNCGGLKIKVFKLLTVAILFWIDF
jgi:hypothetical protein